MPGGELTLRVHAATGSWKNEAKFKYKNKGRIQDFVLWGTNVGEGSGDRLKSPAGPEQSPARGIPGAKARRKLLGFEYLGSFSVNNFEAFCECDEVY